MSNTEMLKKLAKKYNKDIRVINVITRHPFKFLYDTISNPLDDRAVRMMYLGVFAQKLTRNKLINIYKSSIKQTKVLLGNLSL